MKVLSTKEMQLVAGGDYTLTLELFVPAAQAETVLNVFGQVITGQIGSTADFATAMGQAGNAFDTVRITNVGFGTFN